MRGGGRRLIDARVKKGAGHIVLGAYHIAWMIEGIQKSEGRQLSEDWGGLG
jgi:hypothetical protein